MFGVFFNEGELPELSVLTRGVPPREWSNKSGAASPSELKVDPSAKGSASGDPVESSWSFGSPTTLTAEDEVQQPLKILNREGFGALLTTCDTDEPPKTGSEIGLCGGRL